MVCDHTGGSAAFGGWHLPLVGRCLHQHHPRGGTAFAHIVVRLSYALAAPGAEVAPDTGTRQILPRRGVFGGDFGPIGIQLFGHQLRQPGEGALTHLRTCNADHNAVVRIDDHPGVYLGRQGGLRLRFTHQRDTERDHQAASGGG